MVEKQNWNGLYRIGAISAAIIVLVYFTEMVVILSFGLPPTSAAEWFAALQRNRLVGLIQTLALDLIAVAFHAPLYLALFFLLRQARKLSATLLLSVLFALIGISVYFASNVTFSMLYLSDQFAAAVTEAQKAQILNSAQTFLAIYNGTGPFIAYFLYAVAGILISIVMLRSHRFAAWVAIAGIVGNALELGLPPSIDPAFFLQIDPILIGVGGVILIVWYLAIAVKLFGVSQREQVIPAPQEAPAPQE
jgi:hypothetical protein